MYNLKLMEMENFDLLMQFSPRGGDAKKGRPEKVNPNKNPEKVTNWSEEIFNRMKKHPSLRYIGPSDEFKKEWKSKAGIQKLLNEEEKKWLETRKLRIDEISGTWHNIDGVGVKVAKHELLIWLPPAVHGDGYMYWRMRNEERLQNLIQGLK